MKCHDCPHLDVPIKRARCCGDGLRLVTTPQKWGETHPEGNRAKRRKAAHAMRSDKYIAAEPKDG